MTVGERADFPKARQLDLFVAPLSAPSLRDQRETMERPFFALSKKRFTSIEYKSPKGDVEVKVSPNVKHGMATIWDFDILIWAASQINEQAQRRRLDKTAPEPSATLFFQPADLLRAIGRGTGGKDRDDLRAALARLSSTYVETNIRQHHQRRRREGGFTWLSAWDEETDTRTGQSKGMSITLCEWLFMGVCNQSMLLQISEDYFQLTGGYERWLYRIARKHAHGMPDGWKFNLSTLHEKSGSDQPLRMFKRDLKKVIERGSILDYGLEWIESGEGGPQLRVYPLPDSERNQILGTVHERRQVRKKAEQSLLDNPQKFRELVDVQAWRYLSAMFPELDLTEMFARFVTWCSQEGKQPRHPVKAFEGFLREHRERNRPGAKRRNPAV
jgi:plasmid replication initiation protein